MKKIFFKYFFYYSTIVTFILGVYIFISIKNNLSFGNISIGLLLLVVFSLLVSVLFLARQLFVIFKKYEATLKGQEVSSKMLIRRDLELNRSYEKLSQINQIKSEFVSVVAHQLRTPLTGIKWTLDLFLNGDFGKLTKDQKSFLKKAEDNNNHMINIINDMLDVDRIESGRVKYSISEVQVEDLVDSILLELYPKILAKKITLKVSRPKDFLPKVSIDKDKVHEAFENILENAIKYSKANGEIGVDYKVEDKSITLAFRDTGIGIPKDQQYKVFDKFFRAANALKVETDGTGLGLFIVKKIIENNGGKIWFESSENVGTTFYITLPISNK